jgi:hypothetical protein
MHNDEQVDRFSEVIVWVMATWCLVKSIARHLSGLDDLMDPEASGLCEQKAQSLNRYHVAARAFVAEHVDYAVPAHS